jgi:hypothetical protein
VQFHIWGAGLACRCCKSTRNLKPSNQISNAVD